MNTITYEKAILVKPYYKYKKLTGRLVNILSVRDCITYKLYETNIPHPTPLGGENYWARESELKFTGNT
jgi:hypothetical protein